ncbi:MAG: alcohol dehydrogenase catalytic domain-containing protein [Spirochaetota bacterium]
MPDPVPGTGELLVRVAACGICGTDLHIYEGSYMGSYPVVPGHEFAGTVEAVGEGVSRISPGDRVAVEPNLPCNNCTACLNNRQNFCENWRAIGVTLPGAMAELVLVPESSAFPVGDLGFEAATFVEPLSCVLHGVGKLAIEPGASAAIIGAGPIGLLLARTLLARGVTRIDVAERSPSRREFAGSSLAGTGQAPRRGTVPVPGRAVADARELDAESYDLVVDATGAPGAMAACLALARRGGEVLWFGVPGASTRVELEPFEVFRKGLSIHGSFTSVRNSIQAVEMLASATVPVDDLVTHRVGLDEVERSLQALGDGTLAARKVLVVPA